MASQKVLLRWDKTMYVSRTGPLTGSLSIYPPDDTWVNMEQRWNDADRGNRKTRRKACHSAPLSTTNPTMTDLGANPGLRGEKPATNSLSYGTALYTGVARISNGHFDNTWTSRPLQPHHSPLQTLNYPFEASYLTYWKTGLFYHGDHVSASLFPGNIQTNWRIFIKLGMNFITLGTTPPFYF
jgi:hypothetical protein